MGSAEGADLLFVYSLADRLGKTVPEIMAMTEAEKEGWIGYIMHLNGVSKSKR